MNDPLDFLPKNATKARRQWHIDNNVFNPVTCLTCKKVEVVWQGPASGYRTYCSMTCRNNSPVWKGKMEAIMMEKYGVTNARHSEIVKQKSRDTKLSKYGSLNHQSKIKQTCVEKYGVDNVRKSEAVKSRIKQTNNERYGGDYFHTTEIGKQVIRDTMVSKYGADNIRKTEYFQKKVKASNQQLHNVDHHSQRHYDSGVLELLKNKDIMTEKHHIHKLSASAIADELGVNQNTVLRWFAYHDISVKRWFVSDGQRQVSEFVKSLGFDVCDNDRTTIAPNELDILIPSHKVAIEYCGLYWHSDQRLDRLYHHRKHTLCKNVGIRLITMFEDEWLHRRSTVEHKLKSILGVDSRIPLAARKCTPNIVDTHTKHQFFESHHVQGDGPSSINVGLYDSSNRLVSCMGFIANQRRYVLNRYATSERVVGGFSKLLKFFLANYPHLPIETFADLRWSGYTNVYATTGFTLCKTLAPDYYYVDTNNTLRIHKSNFRHKYLHKWCGASYDPNESETTNVKRAGFARIWDCGKLKYTLQ